MKTLGMIGGVSWESTAVYYKLMNEKVNAALGDLHSPPILLFSMNYQELVDYKNQNQWDKISKRLCETARQLEQSGADFVLLCCNTLHKVADEIEQSITVPFIHIVDTLGVRLNRENIQRIGLLGTQYTLEEGFYQARLQEKFQVETMIPEKNSRMLLDSIIYNELCKGIFSEASNHTLTQMIEEFRQRGAQCVVLGCTELGMLISSTAHAIPVLDTTVLHVDMAASLVI